jgi:imidazole glycerol-phosphate synthase subunit HisH
MPKSKRQATVTRNTKETQIKLALSIDGSGDAKIKTGIPFLDHMLLSLAKHGLFDLTVTAKGDLEVDIHHTNEDVGIVLGEAFTKALSNKKGIRRFGFFSVPLDEALVFLDALPLSCLKAVVLNFHALILTLFTMRQNSCAHFLSIQKLISQLKLPMARIHITSLKPCLKQLPERSIWQQNLILVSKAYPRLREPFRSLVAAIGVIDYGMGNLRSVSKAIEHLGGNVYVGNDATELESAKKLVLPGVGAFGDAIDELTKRGLIQLIRDAAQNGKPLLGICLGLQLFFESSEESPQARGLGIWKGTVKHFKLQKHSAQKIPHMGWNEVRWKKQNGVTSNVKDRNYFYFVHSFYAAPKDGELVIGTTDHGITFPSVLASERTLAVQFHPEKSQSAGLQILRNFMEMAC